MLTDRKIGVRDDSARDSFLERAAGTAIATPAAVALMLAAGTRRIVAEISKKTET